MDIEKLTSPIFEKMPFGHDWANSAQKGQKWSHFLFFKKTCHYFSLEMT